MGSGTSSTYNPGHDCPYLSKMQGLSGYAPSTQEFVLGKDDYGCDFVVYGATASSYVQWDESADALELHGIARLDLSSCTVGASNTDGGVIKCGTSSSRVVEDTANMKFMSFYFDNGATSGDNRGMYLRLYLTGAGGGGEACRIFTDCEDVACGTAHGAHISIKFGTSGSVTGLGVASRNTVHAPNSALSGGTYAATQAEVYSDGASTDISGATVYSFFRVVNDGNATGVANVDDNIFLFDFSGMTASSGNMIGAAGNEPTWAGKTHKIRCRLPDGTTCYLVAVID